MRIKIISFFIMAASMTVAAAEAPRPIVIGENTCDLADFHIGESSVSYTYTNTSAEGQLLSLTDEGQFYNIMAKNGEAYIYNVYSMDKTKRIYAINSGETVDFEISPQESHLTFTASVQDGVNTDGGKTVYDPIIVDEGSLFIPCYYDWEQYIANPAYFRYTATDTGVLAIRYLGSLEAKYGVEKDSSQWTVLLQQDNGDGTNVLNMPVEEGTVYYISLACYSGVLADAHFKKVVEGSTPETALDAVMGENLLPEEAGTYWWKTTPDFDGYLVARSSADIGETGTIIIRDDMQDNTRAQSVAGMIAIRHNVESGKTYWLGITKGVTSEGASYILTKDLDTAGDSAENAIELDGAGNYVTPEYNGVYYYNIRIPEDMRDKYVCVESDGQLSYLTEALLTLSDAQVYMRNGFMRLEAGGNEEASLRWTLGEGINNIPFRVYFADVEAGDNVETAIAAVVGENRLPAGREKYFSFTPSKQTWIAVKAADEDVQVQFCEKNGQYLWNIPSVKEDGWIKARLVDIREYPIYVYFSNISEDTTFELEEPDFAPGETFENPASVVQGDNEVPVCDERYFTYTPEETCFVGVKVPENVLMSFYKFVEPADGEPYFTGDWSNIVKDGFQLYEVLGGKPCVISLSYVNEPVVMTIKEFALQPGDSRSSAIEVSRNEGPLEFPDEVVNRWYKFEMPAAGYLGVESNMQPAGMIGFGGNNIEVYTNNEINPTSVYDYDNSCFNKDIAAFPGDMMYISVENNYPEADTYVDISFKEPEELSLGYNDLPTISYYYGYRWYVYDAEPGTLTLTSELAASEFDLYANEDFSAPTATSEQLSASSSRVTYKVEDKQRLYLLCRSYIPGSGLLLSFEPTVDVMSLSDDCEIICDKVSEGVRVKSSQYRTVEIYDASGRIVSSGNVDGEKTFILAPGLYVVKAGERVFKVMI